MEKKLPDISCCYACVKFLAAYWTIRLVTSCVSAIAEHMDPGPDEVQVAWEDGTVENVNCRELKLGAFSLSSDALCSSALP